VTLVTKLVTTPKYKNVTKKNKGDKELCHQKIILSPIWFLNMLRFKTIKILNNGGENLILKIAIAAS